MTLGKTLKPSSSKVFSILRISVPKQQTMSHNHSMPKFPHLKIGIIEFIYLFEHCEDKHIKDYEVLSDAIEMGGSKFPVYKVLNALQYTFYGIYTSCILCAVCLGPIPCISMIDVEIIPIPLKHATEV